MVLVASCHTSFCSFIVSLHSSPILLPVACPGEHFSVAESKYGSSWVIFKARWLHPWIHCEGLLSACPSFHFSRIIYSFFYQACWEVLWEILKKPRWSVCEPMQSGYLKIDSTRTRDGVFQWQGLYSHSSNFDFISSCLNNGLWNNSAGCKGEWCGTQQIQGKSCSYCECCISMVLVFTFSFEIV